MKKVAILQSNYIPWRGYFDMIAAVDEFILYDDMQYTRRDWRNRNQIKTPQGLHWLTVPVSVKGKYLQKIRETEIEGQGWTSDHWKSLQQNYRRAPHFDLVSEWLHPLYHVYHDTHLSALNRRFIEAVCDFLVIETPITNSWDYELVDGKTERLVALCLQAGATHYISGPSAQGYIEEDQFSRAGIVLEWFDYAGFPDYPQQWGDFLPTVTVLDLLFNCGKDAGQFLRHIKS